MTHLFPKRGFLDPERQAKDLIQSLFLIRVRVSVCVGSVVCVSHTKFIICNMDKYNIYVNDPLCPP